MPDQVAQVASSEQSPGTSPEKRPRSRGHLAGNVITGIVVLGAVGLGLVIGRNLAAPTGSGSGGEAATSGTATTATVWTCSMHPQIRQPNPGKCPLCGMDLIPATDGQASEATSLRELSISREARELLDLRVAPVERRFVTARGTAGRQGRVRRDSSGLSRRVGSRPARPPVRRLHGSGGQEGRPSGLDLQSRAL